MYIDTRTPASMFLTASKKLCVLEQQLATICVTMKELQEDLAAIATSRRESCRNAYHKDLKKADTSKSYITSAARVCALPKCHASTAVCLCVQTTC